MPDQPRPDTVFRWHYDGSWQQVAFCDLKAGDLSTIIMPHAPVRLSRPIRCSARANVTRASPTPAAP
jgi:hypothetical protein